MNKILALFDEKVVRELLEREVLPLYPDFTRILSLKIKPYKEFIWTSTYHVVIAYRVTFLDIAGEKNKLEIVCSAHSNEPREVVFKVLKYLEKSDLSDDNIALPRPLFFSSEYNGTFYRAVEGKHLLRFIKEGKKMKIKKMITQSAYLFTRLHNLGLPEDLSIFSDANRSLQTVVPGRDLIVHEIRDRFGNIYVDSISELYDYFIAEEKKFFNSTDRRWLIHGDAHPENIIAAGKNRIGLIDFTDFCPADFARDIGTFMQQLEYKIMRHFNDQSLASAMKQLFLKSYLEYSGLTLDASLQARIDLYYNWTAIRTATFWLLKHDCEPNKAANNIDKVKNNLITRCHAQD
ncbi:MAG: phosphotransferase [Patescibacteria group bacterium]|nr:phosphotransferase [Patescibacteria group bacterium]